MSGTEFASNNSVEFHKDEQGSPPGSVDTVTVPRLTNLVLGKTALRVVHISDTHDKNSDKYLASIPSADVLIHSGDFTNHGAKEELDRFRIFLQKLPHEHKIIVCGNHEGDLCHKSLAEISQILGNVPGLVVLHDSGVCIHGVNFWGSSWNNCQGMAWGANEEKRARMWDLIPPDTDVLVTHNPPFGVLDLAWVSHVSTTLCDYCGNLQQVHGSYTHWGCRALRRRLMQINTVRLHCFGHVHDYPGVEKLRCLPTIFSNSAQALRGSTTGNVFDLVSTSLTTGMTAVNDKAPEIGLELGGKLSKLSINAGEESVFIGTGTGVVSNTNANNASSTSSGGGGGGGGGGLCVKANPPTTVSKLQLNPSPTKLSPSSSPSSSMNPKPYILLDQPLRLFTSDPYRVTDVKFVLDVDAADESRRTFISWRALSHVPANQTWVIRSANPFVSAPVVFTSSASNASDKDLSSSSSSSSASAGGIVGSSSVLTAITYECYIMSALPSMNPNTNPSPSSSSTGLSIDISTGIPKLALSDNVVAHDETWLLTFANQQDASGPAICCYTFKHKKTGLYLEHNTEKIPFSRQITLSSHVDVTVNRLWYPSKQI